MTKLVVVASEKNAKIYEALGFKIKNLIKEFTAEEFNIHHKRQALHQGLTMPDSNPSHFFDPHSEAQNLDRDAFARVIIDQLIKTYQPNHTNNLILIAPAKMLGDLRKHLPKQLQHIPLKEVVKDIPNAKNEEIEKLIAK